MADSKVSVTITNRAPGVKPPVYVAGSFSNPQWVPEPMEYTTSNDGVHTFTKTLQVEPESRIVYKFRVGEGDWWLLNEDAPTVTDDAGNRNNVLEAPKATIPDERSMAEEPAAEPAQTKHAKQNETSTQDDPEDTDARPELEQPQPVSQVDALKHSDAVDLARSSTPEFIKTITEVAESAALLDRSTPEPGEAAVGKIEDQSSTTLLPNAADTAAEVADSAALLDRSTPEPEIEIDATVKGQEAPSEVAAQVADTAAKLDTDEDKEAPSEVSAQVADTAAELDADPPKAHQEMIPPAYKTLADVKADMKDESLDIAGYSDDQEPVPLFAHECAGLYEEDEIPGEDAKGPSSSSGRPYEDDKEDYDDPTLERFPSTRDEIMSTVRKVGTGLNADQVSVEGIPISPIMNARNSPTAEARNEPPVSDTSPISRGQQHLSLPPSLTAMDEHSMSATSLHSIAEDAEGAEENDTAEPQSEYISDVVEKQNGVDETTDIGKKTGAENTDEVKANEIAPVVEQAETVDEVIKIAQGAEGEQSKDIALPSENLPAMVEATPAAEDIASAVEVHPTVQDIASVVEQENINDEGTQISTEPAAQDIQQSESKDNVPQDAEAETENEAAEASKSTDAETSLSAHKPTLESLVTVPSPLVKPSTGLLSPVSDDDEAVVVKNANSKEETDKSGYLTPERAATPQPEVPGSPREPAPNTADSFVESNLESPALKTGVETPLPESRSPQIVVSKPEKIQVDDELLPTATLDEARYESDHAEHEAAQDTETLKKEKTHEANGADEASREVKGSEEIETVNNVESSAAVAVPQDTEPSGNVDAHQILKESSAPKSVEDSAEADAPQQDETHDVSAVPTNLEARKHEDILSNIEAHKSDISQVSLPDGGHEESSDGVGTSDSLETPATVNGSQEAGSHSERMATTSATEENLKSTLKQRSVARPSPADRSNTPISITDSHKEAAKGGNWFSAFLRLVFIDFFGGFVRKLWGGGRKTLVTTAVVLVMAGYASLRRTTKTQEQVVSY